MSLLKDTLLPRRNGHPTAFFRPPAELKKYGDVSAAQHEKLSGIITLADAKRPAKAMPGSAEKVAVMAERYRCEMGLFMDGDAEGSE